jgi:hypothetical protein
MRLPGARGAALVDWTSGLALGTVGEFPGGDHEAASAAADPPLEDLIISNRDSYHLLRFVPTSFDSSVFLHVCLGRSDGNLALARIRLGEMAGRLVLG